MNRTAPCRWTAVLVVLTFTPFLTLPLQAQQADEPYTVRGTVVDAGTEQPIAGAAAQLRGTQQGSLSDAEGRFSITANVESGTYTLRVSLIGYGPVTQEVELAQQAEVDIGTVALSQSAVELGEIVVTGTGVPTERRRLGNVVESVLGEQINEAPAAPSIDAALQGKVTGAVISQNHGQPGGGVSIRLRGTSSILGGAEPLIVVDGVLVENNSVALVNLGANANVLGSPGAGQSGAALSNRLSDIAPADIERIEVIKGAAAAALYGSRANNGVIQIFTRQGVAGEPRITFRTEGRMVQTQSRLALNMAPRAGIADVIFGGAAAVGDPIDRIDFQDRLFQTGYGTENQLSISGGTAGTTYYVSGRWLQEEGSIRGQDNSRVNARARLTQQLSDAFQFGVNANYIQGATNYVPEGEQTQGALTTLIFTPTFWDPSFDPELGRFPYSPVISTNPLDVIENWTTRMDIDRLVGNVETTWTPVEAFSLRYLFGMDDATESNTYRRPPRSEGPNFPGTIQNPIRSVRRYNNDLTANHAAVLSPTLDLTTTAGFRHTYDRTNIVRAAASELPPQQRVVGGAVQSASQGIDELLTVGGFLQGQFGIADRLILTAGINSEASSAFGADERWQFFPRAGASYIVSDEPFWAGSPLGRVFTSARLRASYGETGGQPPGSYLLFNNYNNTAFAGLPGLVPSTVAGNPDLRPERQREYEGGFDLGMLDDRLNLELTYYDQRTSDLVLNVPLAASTGFATQFRNVGVISNKGLELSLNSVNVQSPGFGWRSRLSYARNRNRVEQLFGDVEQLPTFGYLNVVREGEPVGVFFGGTYARNPDGSIMHNEDGLPLRATDELGAPASDVIGDPNPDFTLSLNNDFSLGRNLRLGFLLDGRFGNDVANFTRRITEFFGVDRVVEREIMGDTVPGTFAFNPTGRIQIFEEYIEDGSFVKLREASIAYRFDQPWVRRLGASALDVRLSGRNLFTWTDYTGLDPEINLFSANTVARGVDFGTTPIPRTVVFGITASF